MQLLRLLPPLPRPTHFPRTLTPSPTPADPAPVTDDTATHTPTPVITVDTTSPTHHPPGTQLQPVTFPLTTPPPLHAGPPHDTPPHPGHGSLAHFRVGHRQVSMVLSTLVEPIVWTPTAEPQHKPLGQAPYPCTRGGFPKPPSPPCASPTLPPAPVG